MQSMSLRIIFDSYIIIYIITRRCKEFILLCKLLGINAI